MGVPFCRVRCYNAGMSDPAPKRHWFRFSLRGLFVVVTVVALLIGWLCWRLSVARQHQEIIGRLRGHGCDINWSEGTPRSSVWMNLRIALGYEPAMIVYPDSHTSQDENLAPLFEQARDLIPNIQIAE